MTSQGEGEVGREMRSVVVSVSRVFADAKASKVLAAASLAGGTEAARAGGPQSQSPKYSHQRAANKMRLPGERSLCIKHGK